MLTKKGGYLVQIQRSIILLFGGDCITHARRIGLHNSMAVSTRERLKFPVLVFDLGEFNCTYICNLDSSLPSDKYSAVP